MSKERPYLQSLKKPDSILRSLWQLSKARVMLCSTKTLNDMSNLCPLDTPWPMNLLKVVLSPISKRNLTGSLIRIMRYYQAQMVPHRKIELTKKLGNCKLRELFVNKVPLIRKIWVARVAYPTWTCKTGAIYKIQMKILSLTISSSPLSISKQRARWWRWWGSKNLVATFLEVVALQIFMREKSPVKMYTHKFNKIKTKGQGANWQEGLAVRQISAQVQEISPLAVWH